MLVKGDVKCLHCGHISGHWVGVNGTALTASGLQRVDSQPNADPGAVVKCERCEGPVFLDEVSLVRSHARLRRIQRMRAQIAAFDTRRDTAA